MGSTLLLLVAVVAPSLLASANPYDEEAELRAFSFNDSANAFKLMGDFEGTSMMFKVKDSRGRTVGVFKPTSGSTYHPAEFAAARIGERLGLPSFPATVFKTADSRTLERFKELLRSERFEEDTGGAAHVGHFRAKEKNRRRMLASLEEKTALQGVLKTWVKPLIFYYDLGTVPRAKRHSATRGLRVDSPPSGKNDVELRQCTKIFEPVGCYHASMPARDLAEQFSGILLVDALIGNRDRFAGGNVHFSSLDGRMKRRGPKDFRFERPVLVSLDNGASLQPRSRRAGIEALFDKLGLSRFSREHYLALRKLRSDLRSNPKETRRELGLGPRAGLLLKNLEEVIDRIEAIEKRSGGEAFF